MLNCRSLSYAAFRDKYQQLVKAKADLQSELLKSEEERLRVSKLLIDVQIEVPHRARALASSRSVLCAAHCGPALGVRC